MAETITFTHFMSKLRSYLLNKIQANDGKVGEGVGFERIRRITGYLVGTLDRFNNGKRAEVEDRVKHSVK